MNLPTSRIAYQKYYEIFDRAANSSRGIRIEFNTVDEALFFRSRMHQARKIDRKHNIEIYPDPSHNLHGCSAYDTFTIRAPVRDTEGKWWLYIERNDIVDVHIEELEEDDTQ